MEKKRKIICDRTRCKNNFEMECIAEEINLKSIEEKKRGSLIRCYMYIEGKKF